MGLGQRKSKGAKGGHKTKNKEYKKGHATKNRCVGILILKTIPIRPDSSSSSFVPKFRFVRRQLKCKPYFPIVSQFESILHSVFVRTLIFAQASVFILAQHRLVRIFKVLLCISWDVEVSHS